MKRLFLLIMIVMFVIAGCGKSDDEADKEVEDKETVEENESEESEDDQGVEVEKGVFNVKVTIPAMFFEDFMDVDEMIDEAKADGIKEIEKNDDGSLTYHMSKSEHKKMVKEMEEELSASIAEIKNSDDFTSIEDITHNKDFSEITMVVNATEFEDGFDGFAVFGLGLSGMFYQLFNGANPDEYDVIINVQDADTDELIESIVLPDALDEMGE